MLSTLIKDIYKSSGVSEGERGGERERVSDSKRGDKRNDGQIAER